VSEVTLNEMNLKDDFEEASSLAEASRWRLEKPGPLEVWVTMHPAAAPAELFQARLAWAAYPGQPPSLKFRDPASGRLDLKNAWPVTVGTRPDSFVSCVNYCAEGFGLHPEWRNDPRYRWDTSGNVLLKVLRLLQEELDETYRGRAQ
jgi:hypothetical protein